MAPDRVCPDIGWISGPLTGIGVLRTVSSVSISVLGPLLVDDRAALSPRDQVVLEALVAVRGEALATEQLAEALWGDSPPASWSKLIPSSILRIRKATGSAAVVTTPHGYRLVLGGDGVDAVRFERLVGRGHQFLRQGDADRAVHALREALALWRGRPLAELQEWEPGRFEAERLEAMRREAEEAVIDASLRIGLHAETVPEARAKVAQEPLRERRWALLALAEYLSGDQADALRTLRQARRHLADELGLDPGPELAELEHAILRQDASLVAATALPEPLAENPYPGLRAFDVDEGEFFFGREAETGACLHRLEDTGVLAVVGPSGSGKSSLARAGVMASLHRDRRPVELIGVCPDPVDTVRTASRAAPGGTLVVDQLEEVIAACSEAEQEDLFKGLVEHADAGRLVLTIRADRLGDVTGHAALARLVERGLYLLGPMDEEALHLAINGPAAEAGLVVESGLVNLLVAEVLEEPGALPLMAHVLQQTWESREGRTLTIDGYRASGGIRGAVAKSAELVYEGLTDAERATLHDLLLRLVSVAPDGEPVRNWVPARQLTRGGGQDLVEVLVRARLVTVDDGVAALAHESLARAWPRLKEWLEDDLEGQRILRHLAAAADSWDTLGRPDSELYRGVRLPRALAWRRRSATVLTPTESEFLDASERLDAEERGREETAARRRRRQSMTTRGLVAGLTTLALVAGIAAAFGVRERDRAAEAAVVAQARGATVVAHESPDPTVAALAGVEAVGLRDGSDTRGALLSALNRWPALLASTAMTAGHDLALSSSGDLAIGDGGELSLRDPTSLAEVASAEGAADSLAFLSDGRRLAAGSSEGGLQVVDPVKGTTHDLSPIGDDGAWGLQASVKGDVWAAGVWSRAEEMTAVHLWRGTTFIRALPLARVSDLALSPDGAHVYVNVDGAAIEAYDVVSGRQVARVALDAFPGATGTVAGFGPLEAGGDGRVLAVGGEQVLLLDASSLSVQRRLPSPTGVTESLSFSPDGRVLAGGSDERTVTLWDVRGPRRERIEALSEAVRDVGFSPDGASLYTLTADGRLSAWDVRGDRRLLQRIVPASDREVGDLVVLAPDGEAVAFSTPTGGAEERADRIDVLDVSAGSWLRPLVGTYQNWGVWRPPDAERLAVPGDRWIRVWDWRHSRLVVEKEVGQGPIEALAYTPDGGRLVVGERAGLVYEVDAETLEPVGPRVRVDGDLHELVWAGRGRVVAFLDGTRYALVDLGSGRVLRSADFGLSVTHADASPDGRLLAVGSEEGDFGILEMDSGEWLTKPTHQHQRFILRVDFSSDGALIVTTGNDGRVRLWDGRTGAPRESIAPGRVDVPSAAVFLEGTHTLIMATGNGTVLRWDTRVDSWVRHACQLARRNLTADEWRGIFGTETPYRQTCPTVQGG